jgi:hypothetical protein
MSMGVGVATGYCPDGQGSIPGKGFSLLCRGPGSLTSNGYRGIFPWDKAAGLEADLHSTIHLRDEVLN